MLSPAAVHHGHHLLCGVDAVSVDGGKRVSAHARVAPTPPHEREPLRGSARNLPTKPLWISQTFAVLQDRWCQAKQSAQNPRHMKIEKFCCTCLLRTLGGKPTCRGCHGDLTSGMKILPGQWPPPLNCPAHLLQRFEQEATPNTGAGSGDSGDVPMMNAETAATERPMQHLQLAQLRQEKLKLEKHILDLPHEGFAALREQLEATLAATVKEMQHRKPAGQSLDHALSRHKAAIKARALAEDHLKQAEEAVGRAQQALQTARETEQQLAQEVSKVRASIAEDECCELVKGPVVPAQHCSGCLPTTAKRRARCVPSYGCSHPYGLSPATTTPSASNCTSNGPGASPYQEGKGLHPAAASPASAVPEGHLNLGQQNAGQNSTGTPKAVEGEAGCLPGRGGGGGGGRGGGRVSAGNLGGGRAKHFC